MSTTGCVCHFNNEIDYVTKNNYCKWCSIKFFNFSEALIRQNSDSLSNLDKLSSKSRLLPRHKNMYTSAVKNLLDYNVNIRDVLSSNYPCYTHDFWKNKKYPIMEYFHRDESFKAFYNSLLVKNNSKSLDTLTYQQLQEYYDFNKHQKKMRKDIDEGILKVDAIFIEYYEKTYNTKIPAIFPRLNERKNLSLTDYLQTLDYKDIKDYELLDDNYTVFESKYSKTKSVLLNYFNLNYCSSCLDKYVYQECVGETLYINSSIVTLIFENLGKGSGFLLLQSEAFLKFRNTIADKLHEIASWKTESFCYKWRGCSKYNERLRIVPTILRNCDIPDWHYNFRKQIYFDDMICGHPMASNGWYKESLDELSELIEIN